MMFCSQLATDVRCELLWDEHETVQPQTDYIAHPSTDQELMLCFFFSLQKVVSVSSSASLLLDSLLCALAPLIGLTAQIPELRSCTQHTLVRDAAAWLCIHTIYHALYKSNIVFGTFCFLSPLPWKTFPSWCPGCEWWGPHWWCW